MTILLLFLQTTAGAQQPPSSSWQIPAWVLIVGIAITWGTFVFAILRLRWDHQKMLMDIEKAKREREKELEEMARRVCREFTGSREYKQDKDNRMREIANEQVDDAFQKRAKSFVSADKFEERSRSIEGRMTAVEHAIKENTEKIGNMGGQIAASVTTQLTAFLATRVIVKGGE